MWYGESYRQADKASFIYLHWLWSHPHCTTSNIWRDENRTWCLFFLSTCIHVTIRSNSFAQGNSENRPHVKLPSYVSGHMFAVLCLRKQRLQCLLKIIVLVMVSWSTALEMNVPDFRSKRMLSSIRSRLCYLAMLPDPLHSQSFTLRSILHKRQALEIDNHNAMLRLQCEGRYCLWHKDQEIWFLQPLLV